MKQSARYCPAFNGIFFLTCIALFAMNQLIFKPHYPGHAFFNNWFNDLLVMPLVLAFSSLVRHLTQARIRFNLWYYIFVLAICSTLFEVIRPLAVESAVADWVDVAAYSAGASTYIYFASNDD